MTTDLQIPKYGPPTFFSLKQKVKKLRLPSCAAASVLLQAMPTSRMTESAKIAMRPVDCPSVSLCHAKSVLLNLNLWICVCACVILDTLFFNCDYFVDLDLV